MGEPFNKWEVEHVRTISTAKKINRVKRGNIVFTSSLDELECGIELCKAWFADAI